jgi:hypothetical protein
MDYSKFAVGRSHGKSMNGVPLSLAKSALQKFVRRSETEKAVGCLYEVNTLILLENAGPAETDEFNKQNKQTTNQRALNQFGKAFRTNFGNRLLVMCSEEVNIHDNPLIPVYVWRLYQRWISERATEESVVHLAQAATILANAKKGRQISYLKSAFNLAPYYVKEKNRAQYNEFYENHVLAKFKGVDERSRCAQYDMATFEQCFIGKEVEKAFRCIGVLCSTRSLSEIKALFKEIWGIVRSVAGDNRSIQALYEIYTKMTHQERPLYLYHAMLLYMHSDDLVWDEPMAVPPIPKTEAIGSIEDDYANDHHVSGKKNVQSYIKLLKESFFVPASHHNKRFTNLEYEELYRYIKLAIGHFEEHKIFPSNTEIDAYIQVHFHKPSIVQPAPNGFKAAIQTMPLAQRRTGKGKKFVRIDFENKRIIKGPYSLNEPAYQNAIKFTEALLLLDANTGTKTGWEWESVFKDEEQHYLVAPFVSERCHLNPEQLMVENVESWKNGATYHCFERNSKVLGWRIKDLIDEGRLTDDSVKQAVMQHFYLRYVLGVGDTHVGNMMLVENPNTTQLVAGLDLEEIRSNYDTSSLYKLITSTNVKKHRLILEPYLNTIVRITWSTLPDKFKGLFTAQELADMEHRDNMLNISNVN